MLSGIALFVRSMIGLGEVIQAGIALGNAISADGNAALSSLLGAAHMGAWNDIINNGGLNEGQLAMALMVRTAGFNLLQGMSFADWSPETYMSHCFMAAEGAVEGLSNSIELAAMNINHAVTSASIGAGGWAIKNFGSRGML